MPAPRKLLLTDLELLQRLEAGATPESIAQVFACSAEAVRARVRQVKANLPAPVARRAEEVVSGTLSAFDQLADNLTTLNGLKAACERLLTNDGGTFDLSPQSFDEGDHRAADPRLYLLSLIREIRQEIEIGVRLAERLHDIQEVERFQQEVLSAIGEASPEVAARIRSALHERRALRLALRPPGPDHPGGV
jgi:CheY-specific phosphatase CheX